MSWFQHQGQRYTATTWSSAGWRANCWNFHQFRGSSLLSPGLLQWSSEDHSVPTKWCNASHKTGLVKGRTRGRDRESGRANPREKRIRDEVMQVKQTHWGKLTLRGAEGRKESLKNEVVEKLRYWVFKGASSTWVPSGWSLLAEGYFWVLTGLRRGKLDPPRPTNPLPCRPFTLIKRDTEFIMRLRSNCLQAIFTLFAFITSLMRLIKALL